MFGIEEAFRTETPAYAITETKFFGQPTEATAKLIFFQFWAGAVGTDSAGQHSECVAQLPNEHGDSAHHIAFVVKDTQQAVAHFAKFGIGVAQQGFYGDRSGMYTYMDSQEKLGVIFELLENFPQPR
ncbi:MAG: VOC family protein [Chloroflexi bacterium]|nr:VOC family protein [Chloroflexota bacterium]